MTAPKTRIFEVSLFWNESVIFEERIRNALTYADFFYVSEGNESHSGHLKRSEFLFPKYLAELKARAPDIDTSRVIFVPVDLGGRSKVPGEREAIVRDAALQTLREHARMKKNDLLLIQDFDEFFLPQAKPILFSYFTVLQFWRQVVRLRYRMTYYKLNLEEKSAPWDLPLAVKGRLAGQKNFSANHHRHHFRKKKFRTTVETMGWHHSYLGDAQKIIEKIRSFAEAFIPLVGNVDDETLLDRVSRGQDLFGRNFRYQKINYREAHGIPALQNRIDLLQP